MIDIDFYCIHHSPSLDRKLYMEKLFSDNDINPIWITEFLPNCELVTNHEKIYSEHSANKEYLNNAEISLYLKQKFAIESIKASNRIGVICEDDLENPTFHLKQFCLNILNDFIDGNGDILFIGDTRYDSISHKYKNMSIVSEPWMKSRCAHCYMVTPHAANKIISYLESPEAPFDWQLNYAIDKFNLKVYWSTHGVKQRTSEESIKSLLR